MPRKIIQWPALFFIGLMFTIVTVYTVITLSQPGKILNTPDEWTTDWLVYLLAKKVAIQRKDIALVIIDENSLADYPSRSPVDRVLLASLTKALGETEVQAIGLDIIFDSQTNPVSDQLLITTINELNPPVVVGAIDLRTQGILNKNIAFQEKFLSAIDVNVGHIYFQRSQFSLVLGDDVVRKRARSTERRASQKSFAAALAETRGKSCLECSRRIAWLRRSGNPTQEEVFTTILVPRHDPSAKIIDSEIILPSDLRSALKDKIVIVGGKFIDRDMHLTPLALGNNERIPGAYIHAQIVAQLLDNRSIYEIPDRVLTPLLLLICFTSFFIGYSYQRWWVDIFVGVCLYAIAVFALKNFSILLPSSILLIWTIGVMGGSFISWFLLRRGGNND